MKNPGAWIWFESPSHPDSYGEFYQLFSYAEGDAVLTVSCDSNYAAYINGRLAAFGQYADFEHYKVADTVDVSAFCREGENHLAIVVWYYGVPASTYCPGKAGLTFSLTCGGSPAAESGEATLCRKSRAYLSSEQKWITGQLGFSFHYDAAKEDEWLLGKGEGFSRPVFVEKADELIPRPNKKLILEAPAASVPIATKPCRYLYDLGREEVGFLELEFSSDIAQTVTIAYGEHLTDGSINWTVGGRNFSVTYGAVPGKNHYLNPFRRLGCRYLELFSEAPLSIDYAGIRPTNYPLTRSDYSPKGMLDQRIYDACARTLLLCLHEHYEDCPWREQSFYTMDSRNQMLCGYIAFREFEAPRAGLSLFAQDQDDSGLLSICCPNAGSGQLKIPSFSLHYFTAVDEYVRYSGDTSLASEVWEKLQSLLAVFSATEENGLIPVPLREPLDGWPGNIMWNFYEWRPLLDGNKPPKDPFDLILNSLYVLALTHMGNIAEALSKDASPYRTAADRIRTAIHDTFYRPEEGCFSTFRHTLHKSELGNSLAILCGAASPEEAKAIACRMTEHRDEFVPASLSMKCFFYDALLETDKAAYASFVLEQIRQLYSMMLDHGATTVWEDEKGASAFNDAGSLCHGWSAMPIYYFHLLEQ